MDAVGGGEERNGIASMDAVEGTLGSGRRVGAAGRGSEHDREASVERLSTIIARFELDALLTLTPLGVLGLPP